ncbi:hypothetical protein [Sulfuricurvum sp.]|uniref:hypothetical protein n=1 Tax=Sulfuricurvum sp. TaxID=2025608 RepID=UPI0026211AC6|nr:hypothetical protein [Sulfuricurvum sp.]MDD3598360.1 hypothetical protein [Sulfuricurvum sp.]
MTFTDSTGTHWFKYHGALLPHTPPDQNIHLTSQDREYLLRESNAYFLRWTNNFDTSATTSFWYVIKDQKESLSSYASNVRNQIRKGLSLCIAVPVSLTEILEHGYSIYKKASLKYRNFSPVDLDEFTAFHQSLGKDSNNEFWILKDKSNGNAIGYAHTVVSENMCHYSSIKLDPDYLKLYGGYALIYTMNMHYLNERNYAYVNDGARSISHLTNIQDFLIQKFKFRKAYCTLHIAYRKDIFCIVKILYPFRNWLKNATYPSLRKVYTLLIQEELHRTNDKS